MKYKKNSVLINFNLNRNAPGVVFDPQYTITVKLNVLKGKHKFGKDKATQLLKFTIN